MFYTTQGNPAIIENIPPGRKIDSKDFVAGILAHTAHHLTLETSS